MVAYESVLEALADPTRRAVLEQLRDGPRAVGELARALPVSRPAVSQHLRVLKEAGLVVNEPDGNRRLYRVDPEGLVALRAYLEGYWTGVLGEFTPNGPEPFPHRGETPLIEPVIATTTVHRPREHAFEAFTDGIGGWWPVGMHSVGGDDVAEVIFEGRTGGRVYERWHDGSERQWAEVLAWEPPERLVVSWFAGRTPAEATDVEVVFEAVDANTTKVRLTHTGWERLADGAAARDSYEAGWPRVVAAFAERTADPACIRSFAVAANQLVWRLLERADQRTAAETEDMVHAAHASAWHWRRVGTPVNDARAEWLCSHVYAVLGRAEPALFHARRSLELCAAHGIGDFDLAYGHEGVARAAACAGDRQTALEQRARAEEAAGAIAEDEDRAWFDKDLAAEPWFGL